LADGYVAISFRYGTTIRRQVCGALKRIDAILLKSIFFPRWHTKGIGAQ
jgi:hypothetical protein